MQYHLMYQWRAPATEPEKVIAHAKSVTKKEVEEKDGKLTATIGSMSDRHDAMIALGHICTVKLIDEPDLEWRFESGEKHIMHLYGEWKYSLWVQGDGGGVEQFNVG
jgi:hypothetical protein